MMKDENIRKRAKLEWMSGLASTDESRRSENVEKQIELIPRSIHSHHKEHKPRRGKKVKIDKCKHRHVFIKE